MTITGTLDDPQWDLHTSTGYNRAQTVSLLLFGRTPDQVRQSLGDSGPTADLNRIDPSTNPGAGAADQFIKDVAGDYVSALLGDSLTKYTGIDVLRLELGFGSFGFHGEQKLLENVRLVGDFEATTYGDSLNLHSEFRTPQRITLQGAYLRKNYNDQAEQDIADFEAKLVYRLFIP